jgi:PKD repeat protein
VSGSPGRRLRSPLLLFLLASLLVASGSAAPAARAAAPSSLHPNLAIRAALVVSTADRNPGAPRPQISGPAPNWRELATVDPPPPAGVGGSVAYDPHSGAVVWVGGSASGTVQTWTYSGGNWTNLTATLTGAPPANPGAMIAAYPPYDLVLLAEAYPGSATLGTWSFGNGTWTNLTGSVGAAPPARVDGSMAFDPAAGDVVLFGGTAEGLALDDTWTFAADAWVMAAPAVHPSARESAGMAFDGPDDYLLLAGGVSGGTYLNDSWSWSGTTWSEIADAGTPNGLSIGPDALAASPDGGVLGFGGTGCAQTGGLCNETFEYFQGQWSTIASQGAPSPRAGLALTYDGHDGYDLGFGGTTGVGEGAEQTWALGGPVVASLRIDPPVAQPPTIAHFLAGAGGGYGLYSYFYTDAYGNCPTANVSVLPCPLDLDDTGNSTVTLRVTDALGNQSTAQAPFIVGKALGAVAVISATVADIGQPVTFSILVSANSIPSNFTWSGLPADCPDQYLQNFTCNSRDPGFYAISCVVIDTFGTVFQTATSSLNISARPFVTAYPDRSSGPPPLTVQFTSLESGGSVPFTYDWAFGDGTTSNLPDPSHAFTAAGNYAVTLQVTDAAGENATWSGGTTIEVGSGLSAQITPSATSWAAPADVQLDAVVSGGVAPYSYSWVLGNGQNSSAQNATTTYANEGTYNVELTVVDHDGLVATSSAVLSVVNASSGSSTTGGGGSTPSWEIAAVGVVAVVVGLGIGIWYGGRRRPPREPPADRE